MQPIKVNLLPYKQRWFTVRRRLAWWLTTGSMILGAGYALLLGGLLTWQVITQRQMEATLRRIDQTKKEVEALAGRESQQMLVKSKLARMAELTRQVGMTPVLRAIGNLLVPGVQWREIAVKPDGGIEVTLASSNVVAVGEILENMEIKTVGTDFKEIKLQSFTKGTNGEYGLTVNLR